jgi:hypothetical protein
LHCDPQAIDLNLDSCKPRCQSEAKLCYALDLEPILYANLSARRLQLDLDLMFETSSI